jgi:hypothetical protein
MCQNSFSELKNCVGFEVLTAVVMKKSIFWNTRPRSPWKANRHFGGTCYLHLQGGRLSQSRNERKAGSKQSLFGLFFGPEGGDIFLGNVGRLKTDYSALHFRR